MLGIIQFTRYGIVGLLSNGILYCLYLIITWLGVEHKMAMTVLYILGILQTYVFNRLWTFKHKGIVKSTLPRYVTTYLLGYIFQLVMLMLMVDKLGFPHQVIMALLILINAALIFLLQKYWVFSRRTAIAAE